MQVWPSTDKDEIDLPSTTLIASGQHRYYPASILAGYFCAMINYHNRVFYPVHNTENGEVTPEVRFHYQQEGDILTCSYTGGRIVSGHLIGLVSDDGTIDMRYHQVNTLGEIMTGVCISTPEILPDGRIRLYEKWQWTSGDHSAGESIIEEMQMQ